MSNSDIPKITAAQGSHMPPIEYRLHLPEVKDGSQAPPKDFESRMHEAIKKAVAYEQHRATALTRLGQYHQKQRAAIIGGAAEKLAAYRAKERKARKEYGLPSPTQRAARRVTQLQFAQSIGINTDAMFRLNRDVAAAVAQLTTTNLPPGAGSPGGTPGPNPNPAPAGGPATPLGENVQTFIPNFSRGSFSASGGALGGASDLKVFNSLLNDTSSVTGGDVQIRNWDADDSEAASAFVENGFLVCYTTNSRPSVLTISATFEEIESHIDLLTEDEFGWSDSRINLEEYAQFAVYQHTVGDLHRAEGVPLQWWRYNGDGENPHPLSKTESLFRGGVTSPVGIRFPLVIDPNTMVGIYVGTRHEVNFWVNDVSVDGRSMGSMFLRSFTVSQF